ncbi:Ni/Co efflux regulator RcnB [Sphingobium xenophagum]|uniref:17 kDa surface antigen n=1 Tax=Sphingobium xenophagum TaxID=121428 RepID=A0ABU1WYU0_SPHXE|nr:RcnB family protein [Sphingobium xenophagum]MDR7154444.1 Ni/Co efflux regulator RcnB [Sphingobium xenophagum]
MRMSGLFLLSASAALAGAGSPALAGTGAPAAMHRPGTAMPAPGVHAPRPGGHWNGTHRWGQRHNGRWLAGWHAPGGWNGYRRPVYGYVLPRYWVSPTYYIANYGAYGLPAPAYGYGWSRYYDDAVMTDRYGRVYDSRSNIDWGRYEGGYGPDDGPYDDRRRDNGLGGAAIGAVVGGVAGNRIAGRGNRTAGTLIGAGVGAVAGMAIDKAEDAPRRNAPPPPRRPGAAYDYGYGYADDSVTSSNEYEGRWTGTWTTEDGRSTTGTYEGRFEGNVRGAGVDYDAPAYAGALHWSQGGAPMGGQGGYVSGGYYYPAPVVTTVTVQPVMTTTTTTSYVTETVPVRRTVRRARRTCACK